MLPRSSAIEMAGDVKHQSGQLASGSAQLSLVSLEAGEMQPQPEPKYTAGHLKDFPEY